MQCIRHKHDSAINHKPLGEGKVVDVVRDEVIFWDFEGLEHGLLPVASTAFDSRDGINDAKGQNAFDRSRDEA